MKSPTELLKAVDELRQYDHAFISEEGVKKFADDFGINLGVMKHYEDKQAPKGLILEDGPHVFKDRKGRYSFGRDARDLAMSICTQLGVKYPEMFGRGSQLRVCCDALEEHFKTKAEATNGK